MILKKSQRDECIVGDLREGGAVWEWNNTHPQHAFQKGDKVLSANGRSGSAQEIIQAVRDSGASVEFVLERSISTQDSLLTPGNSARFSPQSGLAR
jgi:hypothetical protein